MPVQIQQNAGALLAGQCGSFVSGEVRSAAIASQRRSIADAEILQRKFSFTIAQWAATSKAGELAIIGRWPLQHEPPCNRCRTLGIGTWSPSRSWQDNL